MGTGPGLCRMLDANFGEHDFYAVGCINCLNARTLDWSARVDTQREVVELAGKLLVGGVVAGVSVLAFAAGWLRGYIDGAEGVINDINLLRRHAQCIGDEGCEWVLTDERSRRVGQPVASIPGLRYHTPYVQTPILERMMTFDVAGPLPRLSPPPTDTQSQ
jgi:hypothetical protein